MNAFAALRADPEFAALTALSAALGSDPLQVQGAGGNTSLKRGGAMLIKASGTWLAEAATRDIFVPVDLVGLRAAIALGAPGAEAALDFVSAPDNPSRLRPSIETAVHAVCPAPVVLHTHCVAALALAIRAGGEAVVMARLAGMDAVWIPYVKPGLALATAIRARLTARTRVLALGNHGLVACGQTVDEAAATLREASARLAPDSVAPGATPDDGLTEALAGSDYTPADGAAAQALARDAARLALAGAGSFYPDHVIFLGCGLPLAHPGETAAHAVARLGAAPPLLMLPGLGAAIRADASPGARAMAGCIGDVFARVAPGADLRALTAPEEAALLDWDAEKYRQALDARRADA